jgi:exonuclease III
MSYITLSGYWYDCTVLYVHVPTEDKSDDTKGSFCKELKHVFDQFLKYHIKILLGDVNAKVRREDIVKPTIRNESLHEIGNEVRVVNFAQPKTCQEYNVHTLQHS